MAVDKEQAEIFKVAAEASRMMLPKLELRRAEVVAELSKIDTDMERMRSIIALHEEALPKPKAGAKKNPNRQRLAKGEWAKRIDAVLAANPTGLTFIEIRPKLKIAHPDDRVPIEKEVQRLLDTGEKKHRWWRDAERRWRPNRPATQPVAKADIDIPRFLQPSGTPVGATS